MPSAISRSLIKRSEEWWPRPFKKDESEPQAVTTRGLADDTSKAHEPSAVGDAPEQEESPAAAGSGPSKPVPTPPTVPRKHERSPRVGLVASYHNFKAPEVRWGGIYAVAGAWFGMICFFVALCRRSMGGCNGSVVSNSTFESSSVMLWGFRSTRPAYFNSRRISRGVDE